MQATKTTTTILNEMIEYHMAKAKSTRDYGEMINHGTWAGVLKSFLPPVPCGSCRGTGYQQLTDSDAVELMPCECSSQNGRK